MLQVSTPAKAERTVYVFYRNSISKKEEINKCKKIWIEA
jgi:hypothetical protein